MGKSNTKFCCPLIELGQDYVLFSHTNLAIGGYKFTTVKGSYIYIMAPRLVEDDVVYKVSANARHC